MPKGSDYPGPPEALARYLALVESSGNSEVKGAKNPYTSRNGHMFSFLDPEGTLALRLSDEATEEFRDRYDSGPVIQYGKTMQGYSSVPADLADDADELLAWYDRSWTWIGTLDPKPTTKKKR
ncbi:MAG: TfoX/Sxy family protein [Actinomycetota bacterium]